MQAMKMDRNAHIVANMFGTIIFVMIAEVAAKLKLATGVMKSIIAPTAVIVPKIISIAKIASNVNFVQDIYVLIVEIVEAVSAMRLFASLAEDVLIVWMPLIVLAAIIVPLVIVVKGARNVVNVRIAQEFNIVVIAIIVPTVLAMRFFVNPVGNVSIVWMPLFAFIVTIVPLVTEEIVAMNVAVALTVMITNVLNVAYVITA